MDGSRARATIGRGPLTARALASMIRERLARRRAMVPFESWADFCWRVADWTVDELRAETRRLRGVR